MENTVKITKAMVLTAIEGYFVGMEADEIVDGDVTVADVLEYAAKTKEQLATKAAKAKEKAAEKRAAGDELYAEVIACVGETPVTADTVYAENFADYEDLSVAKIRARLSQGVKNEVLAKETIKVDGKAKVHYTRIAE